MEFRLRYIMKGLILILTFLLFLNFLSLCYAQERSQTKAKENYNVILIIIDTLRPDHLGCYGYPQNTSPTIDKIAKDSVLFDKAYSNAGHTLPSTMSILTSLYPSSHGMFCIYKDKLSPSVQTMAEIFQAYEYHTAWFSQLKSPHLDVDIGFGRGFQDKVELSLPFEGKEELLNWLKDSQKNKFFLAIDARQVHDYLWFRQQETLKGFSEQNTKDMYDEVKKMGESFYTKLIELARFEDPPFDDPKIVSDHAELFHGVYSGIKVEQIKALFSGEKRQLLYDLEWNFDRLWLAKVAEKYPKAYTAAYDASIRAVDQELIKPIYAQLKTLGLYDKTMIIITADHGEAFGEHGYYDHGPLYPEVNRVPLIIKLPYAKEGKRTKELAQGIDILPTVLDLVGIEKPHQAQGKSLVKLMTGGSDAVGPNEYVFAESFNRSSIRSKEWKLELPDNDDVQYGPKELFHLTIDPQEHKNIYSKEPATAVMLETKLKQWKSSLPAYGENHPFDPGIDQAAQERIKRTGYF